MILKSKIIAIDFDGTVVEDRFPKIGKEKPFAFDTLRRLLADVHRLILWTVRSGTHLDEAVAFCKERGVEFYAINESFAGEQLGKYSRKINADLFIDDRNIGGMLDWGQIYQLLIQEAPPRKAKKKFLKLWR